MRGLLNARVFRRSPCLHISCNTMPAHLPAVGFSPLSYLPESQCLMRDGLTPTMDLGQPSYPFFAGTASGVHHLCNSSRGM